MRPKGVEPPTLEIGQALGLTNCDEQLDVVKGVSEPAVE